MISVIIPTLNEEKALPASLSSILAQQGIGEILVVDGGSTDHTAAVVHRFDAGAVPLQLVASASGRAAQMNVGASLAQGAWLLFLHADTRLPDGAGAAILGLAPDVDYGCFKHRFANPTWLLRAASSMDNLRCRLTHIIYGDQALFIRRGLFQQQGPFPEQALEDIALSLRLRAIARPALLRLPVVTDARKFDQLGHWRALALATQLLWRFRHGRDISDHRFLKNYR